MTYFEAQELIDSEQKEPYCTSPLNVGKVDIITVGEDGFIYRRETDNIVVVGVAEMLDPYFTIDIDNWRFSETVVHRKIGNSELV